MSVEPECPCLTLGYEVVTLGSVMGWVVSPINHMLKSQPQSLQKSAIWSRGCYLTLCIRHSCNMEAATPFATSFG